MEPCPLTGKPCDKVRNIRIQKFADGENIDVECCQDCSSVIISPLLPLGFIKSGIPLAKDNLNLINVLNALNEMITKKTGICQCKATLQEIQDKGIGCPSCYKTFEDAIQQVIPRVQAGETQHKGKEPKFANIEAMKKHMAQAIKEERYEDAAVYRDRIIELEETFKRNEIKSPK